MVDTKRVTIYIPSNFELPAVYRDDNVKNVSIALSLGANAYDTIHQAAEEHVRNETHLDAVKEAQRAHTQELKRVSGDKSKFEQALSVAQARVDALEQSATLVRKTALEEAKNGFREMLQMKDEQIAMLQRQLDMLGGKLDTLQHSITKTFSASKDKGSFGEMFMEQILKTAFICDVHVVSKDSYTADIRMHHGEEHEYLWEVKNYTRMVSAEEIEKFRRDLRLNPHIRAGCMVSLRTGIVGHSKGGDIDMEFLEDGRCILFLNNFLNREDPIFYLQSLRPFFHLIESQTKPIEDDTDRIRVLKMKANLITNLLRSHSSSVSKHRNAILSHKKRTESMFVEFQSYILESETQLQTLLRVALGDADESEEILKDTETYLPTPIFTKERLSDCEGKTKAFIVWLTGEAVPEEGSTIDLKDLLARSKICGFSEKFVRELREEIFQPSAWIKGGRGISGLKWIVS